MTTWFSADHHFGHENIIKFCGRPFSNVDAMDDALVERWNEVVGPGDEVWLLGDFAFRCPPNRMRSIFERLNGKSIHLVKGNHDRKHTLTLPWASVHDYAELTVAGRRIVLFHYALREWNWRQHGSWCLYGHSHGKLEDMPGTCDVGVDVWSFGPVSVQQIAARLGVAASPQSD